MVVVGPLAGDGAGVGPVGDGAPVALAWPKVSPQYRHLTAFARIVSAQAGHFFVLRSETGSMGELSLPSGAV